MVRLCFYETYRQSVGVVKPTYWGGEGFLADTELVAVTCSRGIRSE
jgi:hypothetical protein